MKIKGSGMVRKIALPALAFVLALFVSGLLIAFSDPKVLHLSRSPLKFLGAGLSSAGDAYLALFQGAIYDPNLAHGGFLNGFYPFSETLVSAAPLILAGLSVALAFRAGLFNIGAQGQFIFGAIGASVVGFKANLPVGIHVIAAILTAMIFAAIWGGFVGFLKARTGAHEVIVTIMMNYIAGYFLLWLLSTTPFLRRGRQDPIAPEVRASARLPLLAGANMRVNAGILIALAAASAVWYLLNGNCGSPRRPGRSRTDSGKSIRPYRRCWRQFRFRCHHRRPPWSIQSHRDCFCGITFRGVAGRRINDASQYRYST
jgi:ABC-type uncharacterized transport system permease subunit